MSSSRRPSSSAALPPLTWGPPRDEYDDYLGTDESDMEDAAGPSRSAAAGTAPGAATPALLSGLDPANPTPGATGITTDLAMDVAPEKKRVEIPKLDENRFLEPDALPFLRHECKKIKFKHGKGYEVKNLDKLVQFYKVWAHRVFPRYPFDRFVERSMRLARTKRVKAHLHEWVREEMGWGTASNEPTGAANGNDDDVPSDVDMDDVPPPPPVPQAPTGPAPPPVDDNDDAFDAAMADLAIPAPVAPPTADDNGASAKQRALERLAALKQGRSRARINVAPSPSGSPASPAPAAGASATSAPPASAHATPTPARPVEVDDDDVVVPVASAGSKRRRRILGDDEDKEDDLELPTIDATWD
ncbi:chromosome segregation in meiosis- protein [Allomyces arbusculus]|nr:chromosome segregation in meiosis- protein [Allomyces arbusculus]